MKCVYHFGATYMDGMTGDPFFILDIEPGRQWKLTRGLRKI